MNNIIPEYMIVNENKLNYSFNHKEEFEKWLNVFDIKKEEICIIGSVPLHLVGIRENDDIDFITTKSVNDRILSKIDKYPECKVKNQKIFFGEHMHSHKINHDRFDYFGISNDDLINNDKYHMIVDGFKIFRLELLLSKKIREARPKDLEDVKKIERSGLIGKLDWDWSLVYSLPYWTKPKESLYVKVRKKLDAEGVIKTINSYIASLLKRVHLENFLEKSLLLRDKFLFINRIWQSNNSYKYYKIMLPIPVVLSKYFRNNEFLGWDIILKSIVESENKEFSNFTQSTNIKDNDVYSPVVLYKNGRIIKGKSTIAHLLNTDDYWIEIVNESKSTIVEESSEDPIKIDLSASQADLLNNKFLEVIESKGLIFYAILWPSALDIFDEVEDYIKKEINIIEMKQYDISHDFSNVIHNFYKSDDRAKKWMIEKKINGINSTSENQKQIRVLKLWVPDPQMRYYTDAEGYLHSKVTRSLKTKCRKKFHKRINDYFYDNLIHFTESFNNNYETAKILKELDNNDRCIKSINYLKTKQASFYIPSLSKGDVIEI